MCLAIPGKIISISEDTAMVDFNGVRKKASIMVLPDVKVGDMVLVHAGFAISKVTEQEARETLQAFAELESAMKDMGNENTN